MKNSKSLESQDLFVLSALSGKKKGIFLELGSRHPWENSNTYLLETEYGWKGLAIEWEESFVELYSNNRSSLCVHADATQLDYVELLSAADLGNQIDYLQIDLDCSLSLQALQKIDFSKLKFSTITFEHEYGSNQNGDRVRKESRELLESFGYVRVVSDAASGINTTGITDHSLQSLEDWWVLPELMPNDNWKQLICEYPIVYRGSRDNRLQTLFEELIPA
jgi:hypothetical protein